MLDKQGFDMWAKAYDASVMADDEDGSYPFAGYSKVLGFIFDKFSDTNGALLDLGFGTGLMVSALCEAGCDVYGVDFSQEMLAKAALRAPSATLCLGDLTKGLPESVKSKKFAGVYATYSLHHLNDAERYGMISEILDVLDEDGCLLIGDVIFGTRDELNACAIQCGEEWDDEENYFVFDEIKERYPSAQFFPLSFCGGVIEIRK